MITPYSEAWNKFIASDEYSTTKQAMAMHGMVEPYLGNCLREAFDSAWNQQQEKITIAVKSLEQITNKLK